MSKAKTEAKMDSFQSWAHRWGRVGTLIALIYMVALPFVVLAAYDSIPSLGEVFNVNTFSILLIYIPVGFSEALSYTPILGCSAYLAFITGNIMNLKLPVAANAMNLTKKYINFCMVVRREKWTQSTVHEARGKDFLIASLAFALGETTRETASMPGNASTAL